MFLGKQRTKFFRMHKIHTNKKFTTSNIRIDKSTTMSKSAMEICLHLSLTLVFSIYLILFIQRYLHIISAYFSH